MIDCRTDELLREIVQSGAHTLSGPVCEPCEALAELDRRKRADTGRSR